MSNPPTKIPRSAPEVYHHVGTEVYSSIKDLRRASCWVGVGHTCQQLPHMQVWDVLVIYNRAGHGIQTVFSRCAPHFRLDELESQMCPFDFSAGDWEQLKHTEHGGNAWELWTGCTARSMPWGAVASWWWYIPTEPLGLNLPAECSYLYQSIWWLPRFTARP